jgi:hypothetical protein
MNINSNIFTYFFNYPILIIKVCVLIFQKFFKRFKSYKTAIPLESKFNSKERVSIYTNAKAVVINRHRDFNLNEFNFIDEINISLNEFDLDTVKIRLASQSVNLADVFSTSNFSDKEDSFAINRFIWLFEILSNYNSKSVLDICKKKILIWINNHPTVSEDIAFESYSISERIISWLFFIGFSKSNLDNLDDDFNMILKSIYMQIEHLLKNLEYNGVKTNNHILNNARALYICGRLLKLKHVSEIGEEIFRTEYKNILFEGINLEGSSHYQFLFTKNIYEILFISNLTNDKDFKEDLKPIVENMMNQCDLLSSNFNSFYPLFGDISPDMSPDWFFGKPFNFNSDNFSKWHKLFSFNLNIKIKSNNYSKDLNQLRWLKISQNYFEIWTVLRNIKKPCHSHNDNGSIVLFFAGKPLILDLGRNSYSDNEINNKQINSSSHNMPKLNHLELDFPNNSLLSNFNLFSKAEIYEYSENSLSFLINYSFSKIYLNRKLLFIDNKFHVIDKFKLNQSEFNYQNTWNFNYKLDKIDDNSFICDSFKIEFICDNSIIFKTKKIDLKSVQYGETNPVYQLSLQTKMNKNGVCMKITHF